MGSYEDTLDRLKFVNDPFGHQFGERVSKDLLENLLQETWVAFDGADKILNLEQSSVLLAPPGGGKTTWRLYVEKEINRQLSGDSQKHLIVIYNQFQLSTSFPITLNDHTEPLLRHIARSVFNHLQQNTVVLTTNPEIPNYHQWWYAFLTHHLPHHKNSIYKLLHSADESLGDIPPKWNVIGNLLEIILNDLLPALSDLDIYRLYIFVDDLDGILEAHDPEALSALVRPLVNTTLLLSSHRLVWKFFLPNSMDRTIRESSGYTTGRIPDVLPIQWNTKLLSDFLKFRLLWASEAQIEDIDTLFATDVLHEGELPSIQICQIALGTKSVGPPRKLLQLGRQIFDHMSGHLITKAEWTMFLNEQKMELDHRQPLEMPVSGKRFLSSEERRWIANVVGHLSRFQTLMGRRNLLVDSQIPDSWIGELGLEGSGTTEIAKTLINDLEKRGRLPQVSGKHALGAFLEALLESLGYEDAIKAVAIIFRHFLSENKDEKRVLSSKYGVPLNEGMHPLDLPSFVATLPLTISKQTWRDELEALYYNGQQNWQDVSFLPNGAHAARSVCRLEWEKRGQGTGFLVSPDLILTNYHVIYPVGYQGDIRERLQKCEVRFGAVRTPEGGITPGTRVVRLHPDNPIASSKTEQLDYVLLRLVEPVEDNERVARVQLSKEPIYNGQYANIIQHPSGGPMQVSLRHNQVIGLLPQRVYYLADTYEGSSGAPVFNDEWKVIAVHRAAGLRDEQGNLVKEANEGIPILDILPNIELHLEVIL